jgi:hypothetical protein
LRRLHLSASLVEPIANKIGSTGYTSGKHGVECSKVGIAQLAALFAATQKRRVADDDVGFGPSGFDNWNRKRQQRIAALDVIERLQHRLGLELVCQ